MEGEPHLVDIDVGLSDVASWGQADVDIEPDHVDQLVAQFDAHLIAQIV